MCYRRVNFTRRRQRSAHSAQIWNANEEFLQAYIGKNDTAYRAGWRSLVFSGQATMRRVLMETPLLWNSSRTTPGHWLHQ